MRRILIFLLLFSSIICATAQNSSYVIIFSADSEIARPITIKTSNGTYTLYDEVRVNKNLSWWSAYDGKGNKIMQPSASRKYSTSNSGSNVVMRYHLTTLDPAGLATPNSKSGSYSSSNSYSEDSTAERLGTSMGNAIGGTITSSFDGAKNAAMELSRYKTTGYPDLQISVLASTFFSEMLTLKGELGGAGGMAFWGGISKSLFNTPQYPERKLGWVAGLAYYMGTEDYTLNYGFMGGVSHKYNMPIVAINVDFSYFFSPRLGVVVGAALGYADKVKLEARAGLTFKLLMGHGW